MKKILSALVLATSMTGCVAQKPCNKLVGSTDVVETDCSRVNLETKVGFEEDVKVDDDVLYYSINEADGCVFELVSNAEPSEGSAAYMKAFSGCDWEGVMIYIGDTEIVSFIKAGEKYMSSVSDLEVAPEIRSTLDLGVAYLGGLRKIPTLCKSIKKYSMN